jgi:DNA-binding MarR family transcriptional regulator
MQQSEASTAVQAWRQLYLTYAALFKAIERSIQPTKVTLPQALALSTIRSGEGPMTPSRLAYYLTQETQSVTGLIDRMEKQGWVRRVRDLQDRRAIRLELTDAGLAKLEETAAPGLETTTRMFSRLKPEEIEQLIALLGRVYLEAMEHLGRERPAPDGAEG